MYILWMVLFTSLKLRLWGKLREFLRDQRYYLKQQIESSNNLLDDFSKTMSKETDRLSKEISQLSMDDIKANILGHSDEILIDSNVNVKTEVNRLDELTLEEDELFKTMKNVLNKLHGGRLLISDDEINKAKDRVRID